MGFSDQFSVVGIVVDCFDILNKAIQNTPKNISLNLYKYVKTLKFLSLNYKILILKFLKFCFMVLKNTSFQPQCRWCKIWFQTYGYMRKKDFVKISNMWSKK